MPSKEILKSREGEWLKLLIEVAKFQALLHAASSLADNEIVTLARRLSIDPSKVAEFEEWNRSRIELDASPLQSFLEALRADLPHLDHQLLRTLLRLAAKKFDETTGDTLPARTVDLTESLMDELLGSSRLTGPLPSRRRNRPDN